MTDFVLMPEEATPEMERAAEKYWNDRKFKALSDDPRTWKGLYAAMRSAAPAVQGEPVGFCEDTALSLAERTFSSEVDEQLAEDVIQYARRLHDLYATPQPAEQQPAPDVPGLTEALRQYQHNDGSGLVFGYDKLLVDRYVAGLVEALEQGFPLLSDEGMDEVEHHCEWVIQRERKRVHSILAAHRKQGGGQ